MDPNTPAWAEPAVRAALPRFGLPAGAPLAFVKHRENTVYRADVPGGSYAVRLHRPGHRTDAQIEAELGFAAALGERGVAVMRPVAVVRGGSDDDGGAHAVVDTPLGRTQVDVQHWVADARPFGSVEESWFGADDPEPEAFAGLGRLAAAAHLAAAEPLPVPFDRPVWDGEGLLGADAVWGDPLGLDHPGRARLAAALDGVRGRLSRAPRGDWFGPIHADFTPENVLVGPAGPTLIDFDDCASGWHLFDLATVLFWYHRHPRAAEYRAALLDGYAALRPIPPGRLAVLDDLVVARGCTYLGWAAARRGDEAAEFIVDHVAGPVADLAAALPLTPAR